MSSLRCKSLVAEGEGVTLSKCCPVCTRRVPKSGTGNTAQEQLYFIRKNKQQVLTAPVEAKSARGNRTQAKWSQHTVALGEKVTCSHQSPTCVCSLKRKLATVRLSRVRVNYSCTHIHSKSRDLAKLLFLSSLVDCAEDTKQQHFPPPSSRQFLELERPLCPTHTCNLLCSFSFSLILPLCPLLIPK